MNPRLVMTSLSNFGQTGPYRDYKMSELTMYALGGTVYSTGMPEREPVKLGLTVEQFYAGMVVRRGDPGRLLGRIRQRRRPARRPVAVRDHGRQPGPRRAAELTYQYTGELRSGAGARRGTQHLPNGVYPCADGYVQFFAMRARGKVSAS